MVGRVWPTGWIHSTETVFSLLSTLSLYTPLLVKQQAVRWAAGTQEYNAQKSGVLGGGGQRVEGHLSIRDFSGVLRHEKKSLIKDSAGQPVPTCCLSDKFF